MKVGWEVDYRNLSASEAARLIRDGKISSTELTGALLREVDAWADLAAFITLDRERVLNAAAAADEAQAKNRPLGPLHGVPLVIKDNIHVAGLPNTAGTPALATFVPTENAPVVQALLDAGALVLGKTNMHELAPGVTSDNAAFGSVRTPYDIGRFGGGSSGGTGVAIAARMAPAGLGTDTDGSVRIPAALNGIVGLRPTLGRYSQEGVTPLSHTRDTVGPMARSVSDVVLLDHVITGDWSPPGASAVRDIRLGVAREPFYENLDPEVARLVEHSLGKLRDAGFKIVEVDVPGLGDISGKISRVVVAYELGTDLAAYLTKYRTGLTVQEIARKIASPDVKDIFERLILRDQAPPEPVYREAIEHHMPKLKEIYADAFAKYLIDALIFPTTPLPAQRFDDSIDVTLNGRTLPVRQVFLSNTSKASSAGLPGLTVPMGQTSAGLPLGIEIDGPANSDRRLLGIGLRLEQVMGSIPAPKR